MLPTAVILSNGGKLRRSWDYLSLSTDHLALSWGKLVVVTRDIPCQGLFKTYITHATTKLPLERNMTTSDMWFLDLVH